MQEGGPPAGLGDAPSELFTPWERVVATHDLWPDELVDDITGWFDDLRGRWPQVEWWVRRVHEASASSSMPLLQHVNYVLISSEDFHAFANNPHGLMELGFQEPQGVTSPYQFAHSADFFGPCGQACKRASLLGHSCHCTCPPACYM